MNGHAERKKADESAWVGTASFMMLLSKSATVYGRDSSAGMTRPPVIPHLMRNLCPELVQIPAFGGQARFRGNDGHEVVSVFLICTGMPFVFVSS